MKIAALLLRSARQTRFHIGLLSGLRRGAGSLGLHRRHIVALRVYGIWNRRRLHGRGPVMGQFYIQIIGNNRTQADKEAA